MSDLHSLKTPTALNQDFDKDDVDHQDDDYDDNDGLRLSQ